jgi:hypothetical protein
MLNLVVFRWLFAEWVGLAGDEKANNQAKETQD